jgi:hypothetical protein
MLAPGSPQVHPGPTALGSVLENKYDEPPAPSNCAFNFNWWLYTEGAANKAAAKGAPVALVMSPTRELALQITAEAQKFGKALGCRACAVYGGKARHCSLYHLNSTYRPTQNEAMTKDHTTTLMISDECTAMSFAPIVSLAPYPPTYPPHRAPQGLHKLTHWGTHQLTRPRLTCSVHSPYRTLHRGAPKWQQAGQLQRGVELVVGTPGRVMDMLDMHGQAGADTRPIFSST